MFNEAVVSNFSWKKTTWWQTLHQLEGSMFCLLFGWYVQVYKIQALIFSLMISFKVFCLSCLYMWRFAKPLFFYLIGYCSKHRLLFPKRGLTRPIASQLYCLNSSCSIDNVLWLYYLFLVRLKDLYAMQMCVPLLGLWYCEARQRTAAVAGLDGISRSPWWPRGPVDTPITRQLLHRHRPLCCCC